jgi:hypothetical protein
MFIFLLFNIHTFSGAYEVKGCKSRRLPSPRLPAYLPVHPLISLYETSQQILKGFLIQFYTGKNDKDLSKHVDY